MSDVLHTGHGPRSRLTRRGRLLLAVGLCAVLALIAVLVTRLLGGPGHPPLTIPEGRRATQVYAAVDKASVSRPAPRRRPRRAPG
ncbi:Endolytic murein transglycosylase OS=Streptomyces rimosus subsp. rimosus (strain ATCC/ DSM 40260 / JCM 4667 / NRRL 2234) OX=1265868 GN=mltG PE=3 SV=1 [Streptomyces rimosus subsp. rimosus]